MIDRRATAVGTGAVVLAAAAVLASLPWPGPPARPVHAAGVGGASWTPSRSTTSLLPGSHLIPDDALIVETAAEWSRSQSAGLGRYLATGLRYTHEVNDRSGRLNATGYWATNHPDPAFDRDDDDGDGRWEEAEVTAGAVLPIPGRRYVARIQFSRWHGKPRGERCGLAWDRRLGTMEVLSQLSRDLFGEWQAERYTLTYDRLPYPRVGLRPDLRGDEARPVCEAVGPKDPAHEGLVVTFRTPMAWDDVLAMAGLGRWTAFEAIGGSGEDGLPWTCGGPVERRPGLEVCAGLGVRVDGVTAVAGHVDARAATALRDDPRVARVDPLRDALTSLLGELGGLEVEAPDLTVNDAWWEVSGGG